MANQNCNRQKVQVSYVIRDEVEPCHRSGINSLKYDEKCDRLYSAGRDSVIRIWNPANKTEPYVQSMEHHTDWVNDIVLCCGGKYVMSASSDTTVKLWNASKGYCMSTLRTHRDYVKALAYAKDQEQVASAGFDKTIFIWDVNTLTALTAANNTVTTSPLPGSKDSIYSLATNSCGSVVISGSAENVLRVWDTRTCQKMMKLKGHTDIVKCIVVNQDGTQCISGGSDGTIRIWSLGQQQCIQTIRCHTDSVWSLAVNDSFTTLYSAGRDKKIWATDLTNIDYSALICQETAPVLKICLTEDETSLWVSTSEPNIKRWSLSGIKYQYTEDLDTHLSASHLKPERTILGAPSIKQYQILQDKRHVLTKDSDDHLALYDVLTARKLKDLGKSSMDAEIKQRAQTVFVPNWFSVDLKTGYLTIHLDESECFAAWRSAKEAGLETSGDVKVNFGAIVLQGLLSSWDRSHETSEEDGAYEDGKYSDIPGHTPIIFSEVGGKTLIRLLCRDASGQMESMLLNDYVPTWVSDIVVKRKMPAFNKITFFLREQQTLKSPSRNRDKLSASDVLQIKKVIEHVYDKLLYPSSDNLSNGANNEPSRPELDPYELAAAALETVEIYCNDQLLDPSMDLRTVKSFHWKQAGDLVLCYKTKASS